MLAATVDGTTAHRLLKSIREVKSIREGGAPGSVLGVPEGAKDYKIRAEAMMAVPDACRLYEPPMMLPGESSPFRLREP